MKLSKNTIIVIIVAIAVGLFLYNNNTNIKVTPKRQLQQKQKRGGNGKTVYYFRNAGCPHCIKFDEEWNNLKSYLQNVNLVVIDVNDPSKKDIVFYYGVQGTPTILVITSERNLEYGGPHSAKALADFVTKLPE
jgi:thiol-disulfide isomerase/thioredoxin